MDVKKILNEYRSILSVTERLEREAKETRNKANQLMQDNFGISDGTIISADSVVECILKIIDQK